MATTTESRLVYLTADGYALKTAIMLATMMVLKMVSLRAHCLATKTEMNLAFQILMVQMMESLMDKYLY